MSRLLLNMIVKNEAANLPRMLASVGPHVMGAAITDTGSDDNTREVIADYFKRQNKPLHIQHIPFKDFSQARNEALRQARTITTKLDWSYLLLCDADMELMVPSGKFPELTAPCHAMMQDNGRVRYYNVRLLRRDLTVEYTGATHESIVPPTPPVAINSKLAWYKDHETGANRVDKYTRDIRLLTQELKDDPLNPRSMFYLIQSLIGAGMTERARDMCDFRLKTGGLEEELYWTKYQMALLDEQLGRDPSIVVLEYLDAYEFRPTRAEPLVRAAEYLKDKGNPHVALLYAKRAAALPCPDEVLPVDTFVYDWRALDVWLACATDAGNAADAKQAARLLMKRVLPEAERERIHANCKLVLTGK